MRNMKNKSVLILLSLFVIGCSSVAKNSSHQHVLSVAKQQNINEANIKSVKSCKYLGFIGSTDTNKAMQDGGIKYKLFSATDKGTIKQCTYAFGLEKTPQEMLAGKVKNIFKK